MYLCREYKLTVKGTGIHTPLRLSHSTVLFNDTPLNTISVSRISILNPSAPSAHNAVTKGPKPLKASRMFEFHIPSENLPISVSPAVGIVDPGKVQYGYLMMLHVHTCTYTLYCIC